MKKKIIINASNIVSGGAKTYLIWMLKNIKKFKFNLIFILNKNSKIYLKKKNILYINKSPARCFKSRSYIQNFIETERPDLIFTLFGPSYIRSKTKHLVGVGDGWVFFYSCKLLLDVYKFNLYKIFKKLIEIYYKKYHFKKTPFYFCESEYLKKKIIEKFGKNKKIKVIPNFDSDTVNLKKNKKRINLLKKKYFKNEFKYILYLSSYREHKNFNFIFRLIRELKDKIKVKFIITLSKDDFIQFKKNSGIFYSQYKNFLINIGPIEYEDISNYYYLINMSILPSKIETFSSNIIESFANKKVILISDIFQHQKEFKNNIEYLKLKSVKKSAKKISEILTNKSLEQKIIKKQLLFLKRNKINRIKMFNFFFNKLINN